MTTFAKLGNDLAAIERDLSGQTNRAAMARHQHGGGCDYLAAALPDSDDLFCNKCGWVGRVPA